LRSRASSSLSSNPVRELIPYVRIYPLSYGFSLRTAVPGLIVEDVARLHNTISRHAPVCFRIKGFRNRNPPLKGGQNLTLTEIRLFYFNRRHAYAPKLVPNITADTGAKIGPKDAGVFIPDTSLLTGIRLGVGQKRLEVSVLEWFRVSLAAAAVAKLSKP
jgi:hypothetical protein